MSAPCSQNFQSDQPIVCPRVVAADKIRVVCDGLRSARALAHVRLAPLQRRAMQRFAITVLVLTIGSLPSWSQSLDELVTRSLGISPSDPALAGIILESVTPTYSVPTPCVGGRPVRRPVPAWSRLFSGIGYDWRSRSAYRWSDAVNGDVTVRGTGLLTDSMWYGTLKPSGFMSGFDREMNFWRYNIKTGIYTNTTTGHTCVGQGVAGVCP